MKVLIGFTDNFRCSRNRTSSDKDYVASLLLLSKILQKHKLHQIKISDKNSSDKIIRRTKVSKFWLGVESFVRRKV